MICFLFKFCIFQIFYMSLYDCYNQKKTVNVKISLHTFCCTKRDHCFSEFVGKKWFTLGLNLPIILMCKRIWNSPAFHAAQRAWLRLPALACELRKAICCAGEAWLTQIYFILFFDLATFSLSLLSQLGFRTSITHFVYQCVVFFCSIL